MTTKGGFGAEFIEELKAKNEIVDVISRYVPLEKKGRNFWGRCPFHHEKTPSFSVNQSDQYYHCFGCGVSGDVIKFVQEMESCDFSEAVRLLCGWAGMQMPELRENTGLIAEQKKKKERLLKLMRDCAKFYFSALMSETGRPAQQYLAKRGVTREMIVRFGLGYSPDFGAVVEHLKKLGYSPDELVDAGVAVRKNESGRIYDALFGRLIFPLQNTYGDVIGFGGRLLEKSDFAKYKNTGDTLLFDKKRNLYAVNLLKKLKQEKGFDSVIVVEGYMDTIALQQAGFQNVVASMGTSLTKEQARLLKRFTERAYICYDGDAAGQKATIRGLDILKSEGLEVKVVSMPDGLDPDELIRDRGPDAYRQALEGALPLVDFKLRTLKKFYDLKGYDKRAFIRAALKVVAEIENSTEQEDCLKLLRSETGYSLDSLKRDLENAGAPESPPLPREEEPRPEENADGKAIRFLLCFYLGGRGDPARFASLARHVPEGVPKTVYDYISANLREGKPLAPSMLFELVEDADFPEVTRILTAADSLKEEERAPFYEDCMRRFEREDLEAEVRRLTAAFESERDLIKRKEIAKNLQELSLKLGGK